MGGFQDRGLDHQVLVDQLRRMALVLLDSADPSRSHKYVLGTLGLEELVDEIRLGEVELLVRADQKLAASFSLEAAQEGTTKQSQVARYEDPRADFHGLPESTLGRGWFQPSRPAGPPRGPRGSSALVQPCLGSNSSGEYMLFLVDKYYAGQPSMGLAHVINCLAAPLVSSGRPVRYLFMDQISETAGLESTLFQSARDAEIVVISSTTSPLLSRPVLRRLKRDGRKLVALFPDAVRLMAPTKRYRPYQKHYWYHDKIHRQRQMAALADLIVNFDWPDSFFPDKTLFFPAPQPEQVFYPAAENGKTIDVSLPGLRNKGDRPAYAEAVPTMVTRGGQGPDRLPIDEYADLIRSSKLCLNVPEFFNGADQLNGRSFEILFSRTALVCPAGPNIRRFLDPGKEFIAVNSPEEFPRIVEYYLSHEDEREEIARSGWIRATRDYTAEVLWAEVRDRLGLSAP